MNERYHGKRFASLILVVACLVAGFFGGDAKVFPDFASALAILYGAYLTGQSATDYRKISNGSG